MNSLVKFNILFIANYVFAEEMQRVMQEELHREHVRRQYEEGKNSIINSALTE